MGNNCVLWSFFLNEIGDKQLYNLKLLQGFLCFNVNFMLNSSYKASALYNLIELVLATHASCGKTWH